LKLRAGDDFTPRIPHTHTDYNKLKNKISDILKDSRIKDRHKKPFRQMLEDPNLPGADEARFGRLQEELAARSKHETYSQIKGKLPFLICTPPMFAELSRLACYRVAGFASAPFTIAAAVGFSMPCAITFSMLEMYAPDKFKLPCKVAKWTGGCIFYGVCASVDYLTAGVEKKFFGEELPINAPQFMGTLPTQIDIEELKQLAEEFSEKTFTEKTAPDSAGFTQEKAQTLGDLGGLGDF
jgi:hypothetical protein